MSVPEAERLARVVLSRVTEPGDHRFTALVGPMGAVALLEELLRQVPDLSVPDPREMQADARVRLDRVDPVRELERAERLGLRFVVPGDDEWPVQIDALAHAAPVQRQGGVPFGLWVKGPMRLDELAGAVAIVGSRTGTTYGADAAAGIAAAVAHAGRPVISGAAFGIDEAAHRGAVAAGGRTVAVLACGADRVYPASHQPLLDYLTRHDAVVSEAAPGCAPMRMRFLSRNRVIAALGAGTVVVEAAARSGALNTANWTGRLHRPLMGVPGPVTSASSQGVHELIRTGAAALVTSGQDVLELVSPSGEQLAAVPRGPERSRDQLSTHQQQVLDAVPLAHAVDAHSIARTAGLALERVRTTLGELRELGLVELEQEGWRLAALALR